MFKSLIFIYRPAFARTLVYMMQAVEYKPAAYLRWLWRVEDFRKVAYRKELVSTRAAKMLLAAFWIGYGLTAAVALFLIVISLADHHYLDCAYAADLLFASPILWAHLIVLPLLSGEFVIVRPAQAVKVKKSGKMFERHPGARIAIAGSYGKTTMKEILLTVLSEGKKVKATPANKNVAISHARFAANLDGDEDVLIIEYGEGAPGDVMKFAQKTHPAVGIITGLAPAHLDKYKTLERAGADIFSLAGYLKDKNVYVNGDSQAVAPFIKNSYSVFSQTGIGDWKVKNVKSSLDGLSFTINGKGVNLKIKSRLLGRHLIGDLALAAYLGREYGLTDKQITDGIAKVEPFEHRMKPYQLSGAWIIDDTYNGNIDGMKAGLELLEELPAKRKIYVTPGLVDQGGEERKIHIELGKAIKKANPDKVILMKHSVTEYIVEGLVGYGGELIVEDSPLEFYKNLDKTVAAGDLVLLQNDWPDNYN